jgi:hypothetical protein
MKITLLLLPLSLASGTPVHAEGEAVPPAPVLSATELPATVLPHCLYGFDPHDPIVEPWPQGPQPTGYRLSSPLELHLLRWLGFEAGDVVTAVNGQPLGSAERHYAARKATQGATTCSWSVLRGEQHGVVQATIRPGPGSPELVLSRDGDGLPRELSRDAVWQRLSNPYAFGRYASVLAMRADDGVYAVDKGMVALMRDLGFQPLDHHLAIGGEPLDGGRAMLEGLGHLLTDKKVRWEYRRGGQLEHITLVIRGDAVDLPGGVSPAEPEELELPSMDEEGQGAD